MRIRVSVLFRCIAPWGLLAFVFPLLACSPHIELYPKLESLAQAGQYEAAAKLVEESKDTYGDRNSVIWNLDRGTFLHYAGRYEESNAAFEQAERRMDELYTESITGNVAAFALNDNTLPYAGEDFEKVTVNLYRALNYAAMGKADEALVEARKVNLKLEEINRQYEDDAKNVYKEDGFARLLAAVLYEFGGTRDDFNDAYISNKLALNAYKDFAQNYGVEAPDALGRNLLTTATFMGPEELGEARQTFPSLEPIPLQAKAQKAEFYFIHYAGRGPSKVEDAIRATMPDGNYLKIAFPRYKPNSYLINGSRVLVDGQPATDLEVAQPLGAIAVENLNNRKGRIAAKAIARATVKYMANKAAQDRARRESQAAGLLAFVAGTVLTEVAEQADLRSWQTLPDRVLIGRVLADPGPHQVQVQFTGPDGSVAATKDFGQVEAAAGSKRFFILHTLQ